MIDVKIHRREGGWRGGGPAGDVDDGGGSGSVEVGGVGSADAAPSPWASMTRRNS
jgi:hypothetical protein